MSEAKKTSRSRPALAPWLKKRLPSGGAGRQVADLIGGLGLHTVCTEARCPNQPECHARGTATFLILGDRCTRNCLFCAIASGEPAPPRDDEPQAVAEACARMGLKYVVVTSVTRDDLADGGAGHFARTISAIRARLPEAKIEVLTPDFRGDRAAIDVVLAARPDVFDYNIETVERLYPAGRPPRVARGPAPDYRRTLAVLAYVKGRAARAPGAMPLPVRGEGHVEEGGHALPRRRVRAWHPAPGLLVKSGMMLGVGEREDEIRSALADLRAAGVDILTLGQYLAPSRDRWPVARFVEPEEFRRWEAEARAMGFPAVLAGPIVRSSNNAETMVAAGPE